MAPVNLAIEALEVRPQPSGRAEVEIRLSNGKTVLLAAAAASSAPEWVAKEGLAWGPPTLYLKSLEPEEVRRAVEAMAAELSGYWLRYYGSATREREGGK